MVDDAQLAAEVVVAAAGEAKSPSPVAERLAAPWLSRPDGAPQLDRMRNVRAGEAIVAVAARRFDRNEPALKQLGQVPATSPTHAGGLWTRLPVRLPSAGSGS